MNKKRMFITYLIIIVLICVAITSASLAWFSVTIKAVKSLDYVTLSETIVSFELSKSDFSARVYPAQAVKDAISLGKPLGSIFAVGNNIETKATIAVSKLNLAYYGNDGNSSAMSITCKASSSVNGTSYDLTKDFSYIVCAQGMGLAIDSKWLIDPRTIPATTYWMENEAGEFVEYTMDLSDEYYLLSTNVSHADLMDYFKIDNYKKICDKTGESFTYYDENYAIDDEFKTQVGIAINENKSEFVYNAIPIKIEYGTGVCSVYVEDNVGTIATSKEMNLDFLILVWYNKVDELLDPVASLGDISISISVNAD